jgi:putative DNA primase/helicase
MPATIETIASNLGAFKTGNHWRCTCPACNYTVPTLLLKSKRGKISACCVSCNDRDAIWAAVMAAGAGARIDRSDDATASTKAAECRANKQHAAIAVWNGSAPLDGADFASIYLRRRRLESAIGNPAIRFRADTRHPDNRRYPALICRIDDVNGQQIAVQRVYLAADGRKAAIDPAKAVKGAIWGGAIRFGTGAEIVVAEGPETAIAAGVLLDLPAWSAVSAGNLAKGLVLPPDVRSVVIAADHDKPGIESAEAALRRWKSEGRNVRIVKPNLRGDDFNDVLMRRAGGEA